MPSKTIEQRVTELEAKVERLNWQREANVAQPWWQRIRGRFKDDPHYVEAMRLGREWRESENTDNKNLGEG
jgi:hypothetical protein